jgi:hypothetical protein
MDDIKVAFASTGYGPLWAPAVTSWLRVVGVTARQFAVEHIGKIAGAGITDRTYTHSAENTLVQNFLDIPDATHLFLTEADMILPDDCILKLLAMDKDIASGIYFLRTDTREGVGQPCLYKKPAAIEKKASGYGHCAVSIFPTDGPFKVDCSGLGCILFKRKVFETMKFPWFDLKEAGYGSDMYFSKHARDAGFETWVDPSVACGQIDYYVMTIEDWKWQIQTNPKFAKYGFIIGQSENNSVKAT